MVGFSTGFGCGCCGCRCNNEPDTICEFRDPFDAPSIKSEWADFGLIFPSTYRPATVIESNKAKHDYVAGWGCNSQIQLGKSQPAIQYNYGYVFPTLTESTTRADVSVKLIPPYVPEIGLVQPFGQMPKYSYFSSVSILEAWGSYQELGRGPFRIVCDVGMQASTGSPGQFDYHIRSRTLAYGTHAATIKWQYLYTASELNLTFAIIRQGYRRASIYGPLGAQKLTAFEDVNIAEPCKGFYFIIQTTMSQLPATVTKPKALWNDFVFTTS